MESLLDAMTFRANEPGSREDALAEAETHRVRLETWEKERIELTAQRDDYEAKWKLARHAQMQAEFDRDAARAELAEVKTYHYWVPKFSGEEGAFDAPGLTAQQRARDIMRRFSVADNGLLQPCDAVELESFIVRAIAASEAERARVVQGGPIEPMPYDEA